MKVIFYLLGCFISWLLGCLSLSPNTLFIWITYFFCRLLIWVAFFFMLFRWISYGFFQVVSLEKRHFYQHLQRCSAFLRIQLETTVRGTLKQITKGNKRNLISFSSLGCKNWFSIFCESLGVSWGSRFHLQRCLARSNIRASACEWNLCWGYPAHFWRVYLIDQLEAVFETIHGPLVGPCWVTWVALLGLCSAYLWAKRCHHQGLCSANFNPDLRKIRSGLKKTVLFGPCPSPIGPILCQVGGMLGLSCSNWHIHCLGYMSTFLLRKVKFDMTQIFG